MFELKNVSNPPTHNDALTGLLQANFAWTTLREELEAKGIWFTPQMALAEFDLLPLVLDEPGVLGVSGECERETHEAAYRALVKTGSNKSVKHSWTRPESRNPPDFKRVLFWHCGAKRIARRLVPRTHGKTPQKPQPFRSLQRFQPPQILVRVLSHLLALSH